MSDTVTFNPRLYYWSAWRLLRRDLLIFVLKLVAGGLGSAVWVMSLGFVVLIVLIHLGRALDLAPSVLAMWQMLPRTVAQVAQRPGLLPGIAGILLGTWALTVCIDALAMSGIWGVIARRIHDARNLAAHTGADSDRHSARPMRRAPAPSAGALLGLASGHFLSALKLQLMSLIAQGTLAGLAVLLLAGVWSATIGHGALAGAPTWARALAWALPITLWSALAILVRLTLALAAAPLILQRAPVGEALLEAAVVVSRRFVELYRLFVFAAGLLLVPLLGYWLLLILTNLAADTPALMPIFAAARMLADLLLAAGVAVVSVLFYAVLFLYFDGLNFDGLNHGLILAHGMAHDAPSARDSSRSGTARAFLPRSAGTAMTRPTTLEDYLPREYPNIIAIDDIITQPPPASAECSDAAAPPDAAPPGADSDCDPDPDRDQTP